ncbi:MAG: hypothetical protein AABZ71_06490, partial [Candidatus Binatota bacterium]
ILALLGIVRLSSTLPSALRLRLEESARTEGSSRQSLKLWFEELTTLRELEGQVSDFKSAILKFEI